ncbi:hypothetical protein Dimus_005006 [Dionaea muscipula]
MKKRVIRGKIIRENWMNENRLSDVMNLIKRQKWERLFRRRELMHTAACKEFYANLIVSLSKKKEVATSMVRGVKIELDKDDSYLYSRSTGNTGRIVYGGLALVSTRRKDDEIDAPVEHTRSEEVAEEEQNQEFDWEAVFDEVELQGEEVNEEARLVGKIKKKRSKLKNLDQEKSFMMSWMKIKDLQM